MCFLQKLLETKDMPVISCKKLKGWGIHGKQGRNTLKNNYQTPTNSILYPRDIGFHYAKDIFDTCKLLSAVCCSVSYSIALFK